MREAGCGAVEGGLTFGDMARESNAHGQVALCPISPERGQAAAMR
jgi:hypothetical protein